MFITEFMMEVEAPTLVGFMKYISLKYGLSGVELVNKNFNEAKLKKDYEEFLELKDKTIIQS
jgi:hypothetical protein